MCLRAWLAPALVVCVAGCANIWGFSGVYQGSDAGSGGDAAAVGGSSSGSSGGSGSGSSGVSASDSDSGSSSGIATADGGADGEGCGPTDTIENCGGCGDVCPVPAYGTAICNGTACGIACNQGYSSCNGGCVDFTSDDNNCGGCGAAFACAGSGNCQGGSCMGSSSSGGSSSSSSSGSSGGSSSGSSSGSSCNAATCASCVLGAPCCTSEGTCGCSLTVCTAL
jgi:hypothetical protein